PQNIVRYQTSHALQAARGGEADLGGELLVGQARIVLERADDPSIDSVQGLSRGLIRHLISFRRHGPQIMLYRVSRDEQRKESRDAAL
ncbi:MAG TPA: hypothetical protein PLI95_25155, partial [Polyangiaceae bacterium]|nr:hypothetical protein [Polyangiaceae bacterium]